MTKNEAESLEGNIKYSELAEALKNMKNSKTPGNDGFTAEFFKFFWIDLKNFILNSLNYGYKTGSLSITQKQGIITLESPYHLVAVSGAHFTQGTILIVIIVSSGSAKSRTHQSAVGGFLVTRRGWPGRLRACRIWTFINSV